MSKEPDHPKEAQWQQRVWGARETSRSLTGDRGEEGNREPAPISAETELTGP